jgi:hypothetical protein
MESSGMSEGSAVRGNGEAIYGFLIFRDTTNCFLGTIRCPDNKRMIELIPDGLPIEDISCFVPIVGFFLN